MSTEEPSAFVTETAPTLLALSESDRDRLSEALQELLSTGSINGLDASRAPLYHWARQHDDWLREIAALNSLDVAVHHEERLIQAIPRTAGLRLRLNQDATLVWLALWYAGDIRWRDEGADQAFLSVAEWVKVYFLWRPNLPDEADNHLIELALAGNAETIVTNNTKDLAHGQLPFPGLKIQTPRQFSTDLSP
jgi:hypothetical protein